MGKKRKNSSFSDEVDIDGEADDLGFDLRLARRLKRRCVADKDIKLNSVGKSSFKGGRYSGASIKIQEVNCVSLDIDDDNCDVDADYKKYLDSLSSVLTGDDGFSSHRTSNGGDHENMSLQIDALNNDAGTNLVRNQESNSIEIGGNKGDIMDFYYRSYLDILALEDENACFIDRGLDVNAVDGFIERDNSGEDIVGNKFMNCDASDANNFSEKRSNFGCMDSVAVEIDAESIENGTSVDFLDDDGSFQTQSRNKDTSQNDDLDSDPDYEFFLKNVRKDGTSLVLEIPVRDGISQIIRYELCDGCGVEIPDTTKSNQEGLFEHDFLDETYDMFIKSLKSERELVVYMPENGPKVVYDEGEESSSDSDVVILETNPFIQSYEILSDDEEGDCNKGASKSDSWFREKVMEILRKPFDQKEYTRLLHDVRVHKPVVEELDLRNGRSRRRVKHSSGKSYLDVHKDLNRKINAPGSTPPKVLNLLRGFFYWLQNTPHHVFKPWEDELCLQVLPSTY